MTLFNAPKSGLLGVRRGGGVAVRSILVLGFLVVSGALSEASAQRAIATALPADSVVRKPANKPPKKGFVKSQLRNNRVFAARYEKRFAIKQLFRDQGVAYPAEQVFLRIFKRERQLEMWVRSAGQDTFALLKTYEICALSDKLGPKRRQGDMQTPEGFYYIDSFNPRSGYHLSLHINYPNQSDRLLGRENLGGDIFIHGGCKTEGCMAVTDENIKEIYWIAVEARDAGQSRIPVHIFPARLNDNNMGQLANVFRTEPELVRFWSNLKPGYDYFAEKKRLPEYTINARGFYKYLKGEPLLGEATTGKSEPAKGN